MNAYERERFYDVEIAPALLALAMKAHAAGLSFFAVVEWAPGEVSTTMTTQPGAGPGIRHAIGAARAGSNVDALIMAFMREGAEKGHSSACLKLLGVPERPVA